jgi:RHS repeat-associated protein
VSVDTGALSQNIRFPGQWFQAETGLHQNWMRDYDPTTGRYLQADPLGLVDGASVYGYARMSPVVYIDPNGLSMQDLYRGARSYVLGVYNSSRYGCRVSGLCGADEQEAAHREWKALLDLLNTLNTDPSARDCFLFLLDFYLDLHPEQTGARVATGGIVTAILTRYGGRIGLAAGAGLGAAAVFGDTMRGIESGQSIGALVRGLLGDVSIPPNSMPFLPCGCEELLKDSTGLG